MFSCNVALILDVKRNEWDLQVILIPSFLRQLHLFHSANDGAKWIENFLSVLFQVVTFYGCGTGVGRMSQESDMEQVLSAKIGLEKREPSPGLVDGEEKRMEERKPPSSLKKEGGFGSTVVVSGGRGRLQH